MKVKLHCSSFGIDTPLKKKPMGISNNSHLKLATFHLPHVIPNVLELPHIRHCAILRISSSSQCIGHFPKEPQNAEFVNSGFPILYFLIMTLLLFLLITLIVYHHTISSTQKKFSSKNTEWYYDNDDVQIFRSGTWH